MATGTIDVMKVPLVPPPPGVEPNFENPPTIAPVIYITTSLIMLLSTVFAVFRCYSRQVLLRKFEIGDCIFIVGYGLAIANSALLMSAVQYGLGRRPWNVPLGYFFPHLAKIFWIQGNTYAISLSFSKIAILCLYPSLTTSRKTKIGVCVMIGIILILTLAATLFNLFLCYPIKTCWAWGLQHSGKIKPKSYLGYVAFTGSSNIATDLAILLLPVYILRHVALVKRKKILVMLLLATGSLASMISVLRLIASIKALAKGDPTFLKLALWGNGEVHAAVICACLPTLRPFIHRFFPTLLQSSGARSGDRSNGAIVFDDKGRLVQQELKNFKRMSDPNVAQEHGGDDESEQHILQQDKQITP